jgi:hypothetical protein
MFGIFHCLGVHITYKAFWKMDWFPSSDVGGGGCANPIKLEGLEVERYGLDHSSAILLRI